jgi:hypothetical protein
MTQATQSATKGAIDIVVNVRTPQEMANGLNPTDK